MGISGAEAVTESFICNPLIPLDGLNLTRYNIGVTSLKPSNGYSEVTKTMQDYYSLYTWAKDKQAHFEREAARQRLVRHSRYLSRHLRLSWPIARRKDERKAA